MQERCIWTGRPAGDLLAIEVDTLTPLGAPRNETIRRLVEPRYAGRVRRHAAFAARYGRLAVAMQAGAATIALLGGLVAIGSRSGLWVVAGGIAVLGVALVCLPFATQAAIDEMGLRRSLLFARVAGVILLVVAACTAHVASDERFVPRWKATTTAPGPEAHALLPPAAETAPRPRLAGR